MDETERNDAQNKEQQWEERLNREPQFDIDDLTWMREARLV